MSQLKAGVSDRKERGAALLIAIFALLLISAVAIALIMMAGTESAISNNYRSALQAFYNAKAGIEEGRGRLWSGNPNPLAGFPTFLPKGCYFHPRCPKFMAGTCEGSQPELVEVQPGHYVACFLYEGSPKEPRSAPISPIVGSESRSLPRRSC